MYVPYEILRNLGPRDVTTVQQREADELRGRLAAGLARSGRSQRPATACNDCGAGSGDRPPGLFSKVVRASAAPRARIFRPTA